MKPQEIKNTLSNGGRVFGTMINFIEGVRWAPAFSSKALDYVIIDSEHGSYDRTEVAKMVAAGQSVGLTVIVRVADPDPTLIAIAIAAKADGVLVPYCEDAEMIKRCAWKTALHPLKGKAFEGMGDLQNAKSSYQESIKNDPTHHESYVALGDLYSSQGKHLYAALTYSDAIRLDPANENVRFKQGLGYFKASERVLLNAIYLDGISNNFFLLIFFFKYFYI